MDHADYFAYLRTRSPLGWLYRNAWLYPRLSTHLHGEVLDVGCGIGDMLRFRPGTVGADVNARSVDWGREQGLDMHLIVDGVLPFDSGRFDAALMDNVLEHIESPAPLLAEIRRVLKPSGTLLVGVPGRKGFSADPDHKVYYDRESLCACLAKQGFSAQRSFHMPLPWTWPDTRLSQHCLYAVFRSNPA